VPTIVTTPAAADANAYIDVADADAFAETDIGPMATAWRESADTLEKERALIAATRDVDRMIGRVVEPYDWETPQSLLFPRAEDVDDAGDPLVPSGIKFAAYKQAIFLLENSGAIDRAKGYRARGFTNFAEPNVSGQLATDSSWQYAPELPELVTEYREGSTVGWIVTT
jgi:hypothetical protein